MSELLDKRLKFTRDMVTLLAKFNQMPNIAVALGRDFDEQYERTKSGKVLRHMRGSLHYVGLANDLALYHRKGNRWDYIQDTKSYEAMGIFWESLSDSIGTNCWGGRFEDGNHFSIAYGGRK